MNKYDLVGSDTCSRLSEMFLTALNEAGGNLIGEGAIKRKVPLNGASFEVCLIVKTATK